MTLSAEAQVGLQMGVDVVVEQLVDELVQRLDIEPAIHVGLAEAERAVARYPAP